MPGETKVTERMLSTTQEATGEAPSTANHASGLSASQNFLSVAKAAKLLGRSRRMILYYIESGQLEGHRGSARGWWDVSRLSVEKMQENWQNWKS